MLLYNSYDNFDAVKWEHFPGFLSIMKASFVTAFVSTIVSLQMQCQGRPLKMFFVSPTKKTTFKSQTKKKFLEFVSK